MISLVGTLFLLFIMAGLVMVVVEETVQFVKRSRRRAGIRVKDTD